MIYFIMEVIYPLKSFILGLFLRMNSKVITDFENYLLAWR